MVFPSTPVQTTKSKDMSPTSSEESICDPPGYIAPDQQDLLLTDITTKILRSDDMTLRVGHGIIKYLSHAEAFPGGLTMAQRSLFGINSRLMINFVCQRLSSKAAPFVNVFFLVDTGSPVSYLCPEAMTALIGRSGTNIPSLMMVRLHGPELGEFEMHLSPQGTAEEPGRFHDVNVLGMDILKLFSLELFGPIRKFRMIRKDAETLAKQLDDDGLLLDL